MMHGHTYIKNSELFYNMLRKTVKTAKTTIHKRPQSTMKAQYYYITQITTNTIPVRAVLPDPQCSTSVARLQSSAKLRVLEGKWWRTVAENDFVTVRICLQVQHEAIYQYPFTIQTVGRPHDFRSSVLSKNRQMSRIFTSSCVILNRNRMSNPCCHSFRYYYYYYYYLLLLSVLPLFDKGYSCLCPRHATKGLGGGQWLLPLPGRFTPRKRTR
jgi:hypothetical protein